MTFARRFWRRFTSAVAGCLLLMGGQPPSARAEAMLQYFNTSWKEIADKMPELAEAGYDSLWLPPPTRGSGDLSVGYDMFDPFDLGGTPLPGSSEKRSTKTRYGTDADLLHLVEIAHRFGIRVYLDNIMNHRAFDIPGYNESTAIDVYPGLYPEDFHLRLTEDGFYRKWDNTRDWSDAWQVQNLGLADLIDIAQEPGDTNQNFGLSEGSTFKKLRVVRDADRPEQYYHDKTGAYRGFGWLLAEARKPENLGASATDEAARAWAKNYVLSNADAYKERVEDYLNRAARWLIDRTKADGLRLDAVKHVRADFFGATYGADKDSNDYGYLGQVQRQFNLTRGFSDANHRDSVFNTEIGRDDALVFGEHLGSPPAYSDYWSAGMRLVDNDLRSKLNGVLGSPWGSLQGLDSPGGGGFAPDQGVMHAQSHDNDYAAMRELQHAMYFTRAGIGLVYTDGNYQAETLGESGGAFPRHANTSFLGQWSDARLPNLASLHNDFARGYQVGRYGDADFLAYERLDKSENGSMSDADAVTMLVMINDDTSKGIARTFTTSFPATKFGADSYLYQYARGGASQIGFYKWASDLKNELVPAGSYYIFGWKNPDPSDLWALGGGKPITIEQGGQRAGWVSYVRRDGPQGDPAFNPYGVADANTKDYAYTYWVPRVTNGSALKFTVRADGSTENVLLKLDGGVDINGTVPSGNTDPGKRDNPPALSADTYLGYEQLNFIHRQHAEKFAAVDTARCQIGSAGADTYIRSSGGIFSVVPSTAVNANYGTNAATFLYHNPSGLVTGDAHVDEPQFSINGSNMTVWAECNSVGEGFRMYFYYTTDGTNPEGAGGAGVGTTKVATLSYSHNSSGGTKNWWGSTTIPAPGAGQELRYKIGIFRDKVGANAVASTFPSGEAEATYKTKMLTVFESPSFDATSVTNYPHNDYGVVRTGLSDGFHVLRARAFLKRDASGVGNGKRAAIYKTWVQTFYYDTQRPQGEVVYPAENDTVGGQQYGVVVRTDPTVSEVWYNISDDDANNDDIATGVANGNGNGGEPFTDSNLSPNGKWDPGEAYTDINENGQYDANIGESWIQASEVTPTASITSQYPREFRFNYSNVASGNNPAVIRVRLREISSTARKDWAPTTADATDHVTTINRNVTANGPLKRILVGWPQRDGDTVGPGYVMKVYFTKALADKAGGGSYSDQELINQFLVKIQSQTDGQTSGGDPLSRSLYSIQWNETSDYHALCVPLPNLYNEQDEFLHGIEVALTQPDSAVLTATRTVKAYPTEPAPYIAIVNPAEVGSDGRPVIITLPDVANPTPEQRQYTIQVATATNATSVNLAMNWAPSGYVTDIVPAGAPVIVGSAKTWNFTWSGLKAGAYNFTATVTAPTKDGGTAQNNTTRNSTVVFRQIVPPGDEYSDSDDDGLIDYDEGTAKLLPNQLPVDDPGYKTNPEMWSNGDIHVVSAYGKSSPTIVDTDGDGLSDGLEVGWRTPHASTDTNADTNGDGFKNFQADYDPPFYNTLDNTNKVPGVNSQSEGGDRTKKLYGSMTDPANPDSDSDGLSDGIEDKDRDGWVDGDGETIAPTAAASLSRKWPNGKMDAGEVWTETDPNNPDTDGDGLTDGNGEDKNFNGYIDGDTNGDRIHSTDEMWTETDPLKRDTDEDGLPDGWESRYGLDSLDNGTKSLRTGAAGNPRNGASADPDEDTFNNATEFANGTDPLNKDTGAPIASNQIVIGEFPQAQWITRGGITNKREFTDWTANDLMVLDEFDEGGNVSDIYRLGKQDSSRDITAFYVHDGGAKSDGGDGMVYFRVDMRNLEALAEQQNLNIFVVVDTGSPNSGEYNLPEEVDTGTEMRWEAVVVCYDGNGGRVYVDTNRDSNTVSIGESFSGKGIDARGVASNGFGRAYFNSELDSVEFSISRQALIDAGWNGLNAATLNFQVFTTRDFTGNGSATAAVGAGDLGGRTDICDTIYDDGLASDYWKDQSNISGDKGILKSWFGWNASNDRGKSSKVISLLTANEANRPGSEIMAKINTGTGTGWYRPFDVHEAYGSKLALAITPTTASAIQWAVTDPAVNKSWRNGPTFNDRIADLAAPTNGIVSLLGTTFSGHALPYYSDSFNADNISQASSWLERIYGVAPSFRVFYPAERLLDTAALTKITTAKPSGLGFDCTFIDQMQHVRSWFNRTAALTESAHRVQQINGAKAFVINDGLSEYRFLNTDNGLGTALRDTLARKARSNIQDQSVILISDLNDFATATSADAYDKNIRWLASRPWIRITTPDEIAADGIEYKGQDGQQYTNWGTVNRNDGLTNPITKTAMAKDFVQFATLGSFDNWWNGKPGVREGLKDKKFNIRTNGTNVVMTNAFGQVGVSGVADTTWNLVRSNTTTDGNRGGIGRLARAAAHAANFVSAFHTQTNVNLAKYSTGDYIYPSTAYETLADFAKVSQAEMRQASVYKLVNAWATGSTPTTVARSEDVDQDGELEYLLYNDRVFAVFEAIGGRLVNAWTRDPVSGAVRQVIGNPVGYKGGETEEEGESNVTLGGAVVAYRTSAFKDWWAAGPNSNKYVNDVYTPVATTGATGWRFTSSDSKVTKEITLGNASALINARYTLDPSITTLYVRFGLSPNLEDLLINGQTNLQQTSTASTYNVRNTAQDGQVRTFLQTAGSTYSGATVNTVALDYGTPRFDTLAMLNQAQTRQVELFGASNMTFALGLESGSTVSDDTDNDGLPDGWENANFDTISRDGSGDFDGDGLTDKQEYVFGTGPKSASDAWHPTFVNEGSGFRVTFPTISGRTYTVKYRGDIDSGTWTAVSNQTNPVSGDGNEKTVTDTSSGNANRRFYRVEVSVP